MTHSSFYSSKQWRDAREKYLRSNPYCGICSLIGIKTRAVEVDHLRPIASGGALLDPRNFSSKCRTHHSQKTRVLDTPGQAGRNKLVTTGLDGFPTYVEIRYGKKIRP